MRKIFWVTSLAYTDTDIPIIAKLQSYYDITALVIVPCYEKSFDENFILNQFTEKRCDIQFYYNTSKYGWLLPFEVYRIAKRIRKSGADLYYISNMAMPWGTLVYKRVIDIKKCVVPCHNVSVPKGARLEKLARWYTDKWLSTFSNIQVFSKSQHEVLEAGYQGKKILETPFLLKDYGEPKRKETYAQDGIVKFLIFGNILPYKRVDLLIEAGNILYERGYKNIIIRIAGYCKDWVPYQQMIRHEEVFDLRIKRIPNEEVADLFGDSHYFVQPYQDIAQSGAMVVAFRYGLPSVVSDIKQFEEFVKDGYNGRTFKTGDASSLADTMENLVKDHTTLYPTLWHNQQTFVDEHYSDRAIVNAHIAYFNQIIKRNDCDGSVRSAVKNHLCMGCGICSVGELNHQMVFSKSNDCMVPSNWKNDDAGLSDFVCPAKGYAIKSEAENLFGLDGKYDVELGYVHSLVAAHAIDGKVLENASSGGLITLILCYLLEKGLVDYVSVTHFECDSSGVHTRTFLTNKKEDILKAQGSKYCPVDLSGLIEELHTTDAKVAIMATPCAVAGIRNIQKEDKNYIKADVRFMISNFCGGHKSFKNIKRLAEIHHVDYYNLKDFRFRGEGQPGSLRFVEKSGKVAKTAYPLYVGLNGYSKMLRCHLCVDATGELADIACGDAWIPRFEKDEHPWSMMICRTKETSAIIEQMAKENYLTVEKVTMNEVKLSQRLNLASKKKRQATRRKLYGMLGYKLPNLYDEGYNLELTSMKTEWTVFLKHKMKLMAEKTGLYMKLYGYKKLKK